MQVSISRERFLGIVRTVGASVIWQSGNLAPADKKLYALRDVTDTVDSIPLIASSIMSKKIAAGSDCMLLDVKTGSGAFMKTVDSAVRLAKTMVSIGESAGRRTVALITDMNQPLGTAIGNSLEVAEACRTLRGEGPKDLTVLSVELAADMLVLAGKGDRAACRAAARQCLADGTAFRKFKEMVAAQGGDVSVLDDPSRFPQAKQKHIVRAPASGFLYSMDAEQCGLASMELGAGRKKKEDEIDPSAGIILKKKTGDPIREGDPLAVLYSSSGDLCAAAERTFLGAVAIRPEKPEPRPLLIARVDKDGFRKL
jgi:pyrimidine-nucleoside phosphorylase